MFVSKFVDFKEAEVVVPARILTITAKEVEREDGDVITVTFVTVGDKKNRVARDGNVYDSAFILRKRELENAIRGVDGEYDWSKMELTAKAKTMGASDEMAEDAAFRKVAQDYELTFKLTPCPKGKYTAQDGSEKEREYDYISSELIKVKKMK